MDTIKRANSILLSSGRRRKYPRRKCQEMPQPINGDGDGWSWCVYKKPSALSTICKIHQEPRGKTHRSGEDKTHDIALNCGVCICASDMNLSTSLFLLGLCSMFSCLAVSGSKAKELTRPFIVDAFKEAKQIVDDSYLYSRKTSLERVRSSDFVKPSDTLRLMKQPKRKSREAVRAADYLEQTLRIIAERTHHAHKRSINATALLTLEELELIAKLTGCAAQTLPPPCRTTQNLNRYRTASSVCNNERNPLQGASNTAFTRWLPPVYEDRISEPQGWNPGRLYNNVVLPLVRLVSNRIFSTQDRNVVGDNEFTLLITFFGQWNDHDLSFTPMSPSIRSFSNGINCDDSCERSEPCFPIQIPRDDPRLPSGPNNCLPVFRSAPACGSGYSAYMFGGVPRVREQINTLTSFLDAGQLYGSEDGLSRDLRDLSNDAGLMRVNDRFKDNGRELLPFTRVVSKMCTTRNRIQNTTGLEEVPCFIAGDERVDENIALTSLHTLFLREHNRLARALRRLNPQWGNEQIYQEARKIVGAYHQIIVFRDYLPHIVGQEAMRRQLGRYPGYNANINPTISNVFATAAYRFAHATIQPVIFRLDENFQENQRAPSVPLQLAFFTPWRILFEGGIDPQIRGLISRPAKLNRQDGILVDAVRERLFAFTSQIAQDLGSLNLQRSRDHGLPSYNAWRRFCGLSTPRNVNELARVLNNTDLARRLIQLYGTPDNIDLWAAGIAEPFVTGGRVGPLFSCIIATQFQRIRQGDRLWWENMGVFTLAQRSALNRVSLSRIICDNTGISRVPRNPFILSRNLASFVNCGNIPGTDLSPWQESKDRGRKMASDENEISREKQSDEDPEELLENQVSRE
ncbi:eosinophil peroxidase isoform X2 [Hemibagrus wyckioides]|uniref:eosinophil peroxidase isoform X2 n=1 Tax=Hemibagrus wyckioides TaxID=337641 RepID=UPI00266D5C01|nr:eosinophil peroxidase isoform X2 [Hemibagrus wyckioides]